MTNLTQTGPSIAALKSSDIRATETLETAQTSVIRHQGDRFLPSAVIDLVSSSATNDHASLLRWLSTGTLEIPTGPEGEDLAFEVDGQRVRFSAIDVPAITKLKWSIITAGADQSYRYVGVYVGNQPILMHRFILGAASDERGDHINGDTLDNRRSNLRRCSHSQNMKNRKRHKNAPTIYKGVRLKNGGWYAKLRNDGVNYSSRSFIDLIDAAKAYDALAIKHHGEFARLNFPILPAPPFDSDHNQRLSNRTRLQVGGSI